MKKRGLGEGKWNAPGGKVLEEESLENSAIREVEEETGLIVRNLRPLGKLEFIWPKGELSKNNNKCYIFSTTDFSGDIKETEECLPKWFLVSEIPYQDMWEDDIIWLPELLKNKAVYWKFTFNENNSIVEQEKLYG